MKRENKLGPKVLGGLPDPPRVGVDELKSFVRNTGVALIDTRERYDFLNGHIPGAIFSPLDKQFNTTAGSYVVEAKPVYLIIEKTGSPKLFVTSSTSASTLLPATRRPVISKHIKRRGEKSNERNILRSRRPQRF
jgi:rhodanese-related sulfurtransferase